MATDIHVDGLTVVDPVTMSSSNGPLLHKESLGTLVVVYSANQDSILWTVAKVLGKAWTTVTSLSKKLCGSDAVVIGIRSENLQGGAKSHDKASLTLINTHCIDDGSAPDESLTEECHYEFLYYNGPYLRRDLARFLSLILGQVRPHEELSKKKRTNFISTTFPDVRTALPNLDILSVGSDAVEIRVDLLEEPSPEGGVKPIPSLKYVGHQLILLRQRTELPIIFTTRCMNENGKFPMNDPDLFYRYLRRAIRWGVEYIDVELWLPEEIRRRLAEVRGNSTIMSAFHDFSGHWKWTSPEAQRVFREGSKYADIVKMIAMAGSIEANYELEYFRSTIKARFSHPLLSAVNMGQKGQMSRVMNTVFSPITHPLLPIIAAPGQLTAAEINEAMHIMGQIPKRDMYAIGSFHASPHSMFIKKCFNELGLNHNFSCIDRGPRDSIEAIVMHPNFGGAYINPPLANSTLYIPSVSDAAQTIGSIDTITVQGTDENRNLVGENASWKGIYATLTRDYVPSAYRGRVAIILSNSEDEASAAIYALKNLNIGTIYTVGFRANSGPLATELEPFTSIQSVKHVEQPFVIVSALPAEKSILVQPLLRHYSANGRSSPRTTRGKVFMDLATGPRKGEPLEVATNAGWSAYGAADVDTWTTVETLRMLVNQNVPFDFVRMASGRGFY